jgi:hypothetical protein
LSWKFWKFRQRWTYKPYQLVIFEPKMLEATSEPGWPKNWPKNSKSSNNLEQDRVIDSLFEEPEPEPAEQLSDDEDFEDRLDEILDLDLKPEGFERRLTELVKDYTEEPNGQLEPASNLTADSNDDLQLSLEEYFGAMKEHGY